MFINVALAEQLDAMYITDAAKLMSGCLSALTAMVHLELPHVNVLTKCDLTDMKLVRSLPALCALCGSISTGRLGGASTSCPCDVFVGASVLEPEREGCGEGAASDDWPPVQETERSVRIDCTHVCLKLCVTGVRAAFSAVLTLSFRSKTIASSPLSL